MDNLQINCKKSKKKIMHPINLPEDHEEWCFDRKHLIKLEFGPTTRSKIFIYNMLNTQRQFTCSWKRQNQMHCKAKEKLIFIQNQSFELHHKQL